MNCRTGLTSRTWRHTPEFRPGSAEPWMAAQDLLDRPLQRTEGLASETHLETAKAEGAPFHAR